MPHDDIVTSPIFNNLNKDKHTMSDIHDATAPSDFVGYGEPPTDAPPNETKAAKFKRIATYRLIQTRERIRLLSNCCNEYSYEYTPEQVTKIVTLLRKDIDELERAFTAGKEKENLTVEL